MGWPAPAYAHHPLVLDRYGKQLAKRDKAATLRDMRTAGITASEILARIGYPGIR